MSERHHEALLEALGSGDVFGTADVSRIDTHAAHVFLVGELAYKIKRPVTFSFLDFSTLEARKAAIDEEIRLNRRTAPELYRRVVKITREADGFTLDGEGPVVEWALEMNRFPQDAQLDRVADRGPLDPLLTERLAISVAEFHQAAEVRRDMGGKPAMAEIVDGNRIDLDAARPGVFDPAVIEAVDQAAKAAVERLGPLLDARRDEGFVKHCHGDLHLANMVALDDHVVAFDCLEFREDFACTDTMYDLAYLLKDLVARDQGAAAWRVLQVYLDETGDIAGLQLLPFFMAVRATIRAKVRGLGIVDPTAEAAEVEAVRSYLDLAHRLEPAPAPMLLAIGGFSGSGKTTLARALAPAIAPLPGAVLLRSDVERKRLAGVPPTQKLPGEAYDAANSERVFTHLRGCAREILAAGMSVVVDAVHGRPEERAAIAATAKDMGVTFKALWLDASVDARSARCGSREGDASDADAAVARMQASRDPGPLDWPRIDTGCTPSAVAEAAKSRLGL